VATPRKKKASRSSADPKTGRSAAAGKSTKKASKTPKKASRSGRGATKSTAKKTVTKTAVKKKVTRKKSTKKTATTRKKATPEIATPTKTTAKKASKAAASPSVTKTSQKASGRKKVTASKKATRAAATSTRPRGTPDKLGKKPGSARKPPARPYASLEAPRPEANGHSYYQDQLDAPTTAQLRKVKTGLTTKDLKYFRQQLLERRAEIIGDVQGLEAARSGNAGELSHMPLHMADVGSDNYEQEFMLGLMESERKTILEIDEALQRIVDRTFGVCLASAKPISRPRLEAKPWARYCIEVARDRERRGL
jgi:RNA polymerase-binding transcription factor DksA